MVSHIKLHGGKYEWFEEIKENLQDEFGYEPSNPEVRGMLMADYSNNNRDEQFVARSMNPAAGGPA